MYVFNCLLSVMFWVSIVTFASGLYIGTSTAINCRPATSALTTHRELVYHTYVQKWWSGKLFTNKKLVWHVWSLLTRITQPDYYVSFSPPYPLASITMKNASDTQRVNTPFPVHILYRYGLSKGMMPNNFRTTHPILIKRVPKYSWHMISR